VASRIRQAEASLEPRIERVAQVYPAINRPENAAWKAQYELRLNSEETFPMLVKGMKDCDVSKLSK
jgi:hypothetical protein